MITQVTQNHTSRVTVQIITFENRLLFKLIETIRLNALQDLMELFNYSVSLHLFDHSSPKNIFNLCRKQKSDLFS